MFTHQTSAICKTFCCFLVVAVKQQPLMAEYHTSSNVNPKLFNKQNTPTKHGSLTKQNSAKKRREYNTTIDHVLVAASARYIMPANKPLTGNYVSSVTRSPHGQHRTIRNKMPTEEVQSPDAKCRHIHRRPDDERTPKQHKTT